MTRIMNTDRAAPAPGLAGMFAGPAQVVPLSWLRLMQLTSSQCPIGSFAYSQALEAAVERGWVHDEASLADWLSGIGSHAVAALDLPLLSRAHGAWQCGDDAEALAIAERLLCQREARELLEQERQLGKALGAVLENLGVTRARALSVPGPASYVVAYALGAVHFGVEPRLASLGYAFAWAEQQTNAAARLVPLGHMAAQRVLSRVLLEIPSWVLDAAARSDDEIGNFTPGLAMGGAWHETQYTRLFRS
jgi:urease accessory protein